MLQSMKELKAVCIYEPAIDFNGLPKETLTEYARTRDWNTIKGWFKTGAKPIIYHIRRIPRSLFLRQVMEAPSETARDVLAFQFGVTMVENLPGDDGVVVNFAPTGSTPTLGGALTTVSDQELSRWDGMESDILEIGKVAFYHSFLGKRVARCFRVPPLSLDILGSLAVQLADANQTTEPLNNSKLQPSSAGIHQRDTTVPGSGSDGETSGEATGATAGGR